MTVPACAARAEQEHIAGRNELAELDRRRCEPAVEGGTQDRAPDIEREDDGDTEGATRARAGSVPGEEVP